MTGRCGCSRGWDPPSPCLRFCGERVRNVWRLKEYSVVRRVLHDLCFMFFRMNSHSENPVMAISVFKQRGKPPTSAVCRRGRPRLRPSKDSVLASRSRSFSERLLGCVFPCVSGTPLRGSPRTPHRLTSSVPADGSAPRRRWDLLCGNSQGGNLLSAQGPVDTCNSRPGHTR